VGGEPHPPYARPPLSKNVLAGPDASADLYTEQELRSLDIEFRTATVALGLDVASGRLRLSQGLLEFDHLIIATGVAARRPAWARGDGVHLLRTRDDVAGLLSDLREGGPAVIVGGGVLASEAASTLAATRECALVVRGGELRLGAVGGAFSSRIIDLHESHGVGVHLQEHVDTVLAQGRGLEIRTQHHRHRADAVVVAVGSQPAVEWLSGTGIGGPDGVLCDAAGRASSTVSAVGDVAAWWDPVAQRHVRVEHQSAALEHASIVAQRLLNGVCPDPPVPFFSSELYGTRIQICGRFGPGAPWDYVHGAPGAASFVALATTGALRGLVGWDAPRAFREARRARPDLMPAIATH